jgi:pyruvate/2-oxoglutarate/acetoin dehydrogenase E1 component
MAMRGMRPVVEIMFGDFLTLAADQLINHIAKFRWMYHDQVRVPVVIRTPMGGRRGYGPTHSQTLEKLFLGVPGLKVVAPCALQADDGEMDAGQLLQEAIADEEPVIFIENKLLYLSQLQNRETLADFDIGLISQTTDSPNAPQSGYPTYKLTIKGAPAPVLTLAAYGHMAELAREAALQLAYQHEVFTELIVATQLSPFAGPMQAILDSVRRTKRLLVAEEGTLSLGWGAEILARAAESLGADLVKSGRVAAQETPVPAAGALEETALPDIEDMVQVAYKLCR